MARLVTPSPASHAVTPLMLHVLPAVSAATASSLRLSYVEARKNVFVFFVLYVLCSGGNYHVCESLNCNRIVIRDRHLQLVPPRLDTVKRVESSREE